VKFYRYSVSLQQAIRVFLKRKSDSGDEPYKRCRYFGVTASNFFRQHRLVRQAVFQENSS